MSADQTPDYRDTVFLPETDFPMRAGLPQREPEWLARWERLGVYDRLRSEGQARAPFVLHEGAAHEGDGEDLTPAAQAVLRHGAALDIIHP